MKIVKIASVVVVLLSAFSFVSCDTEPVDPVLNNNNGENPGENPGTGTAVFKVDYNGATHNATNATAVAAPGQLQIIALMGTNGESVFLGVDGNIAAGTTYGADELLMGYNPNGEDEDGFVNFTTSESSGTLTITTIDTANHTISGTFSFKGWSTTGDAEPIVFTNGIFNNISYSGTIEGENPVEQEDIFKAKINGTLKDYSNTDLSVFVSGEEGHKYIAIMGQDGGISTMTLGLYSDYSAGTYTITGNFDEPYADYALLDEPNDLVGVSEGTITVTSNANGRIKGTFTFPVKNEAGETIYTITNGEFDVEWDL